MILNGKRNLSAQSVEKIARGLELKGRERQYFVAMSLRHSSKCPEQRSIAQEKMLQIKKYQDPTLISLEQYRFLSVWYYPVLFVLAGMRACKWDLKWLSSKIGRSVPPQKIRNAIADLVWLGILRQKDSGYERVIVNPTTFEDFEHLTVRRYHQQMLEKAIEGLELPVEEREYNGLTAGVPKSLIPEIKQKIRKFRKELNEYLDSYEGESEDVYQVNIQFFPLTRSEEQNVDN
jgi:uncharacterized protein (TIGR02147 family)